MSLPASFSNNTSPTGVQLDNNFAAVANMAVWNCSATGTNVIALTTTSNQPAVSAYTDRQRFQFIGPNNSTSSVTAAVNSLSALPVYKIDGSQAGSGDVASGTPYEIIYLAALNSNNGGFQIISAVASSAVAAVAAAKIQGLVVTNNSSTPATKIDITAGQALAVTTGGTPKFLSSASVTIDLTTTGANGMDTGSRPTNGWVYCYLISNGSVTAGLATASSPTAAAPTLPGGYTYAAYCGAMFLDGSQNLLRSVQNGRRGQYKTSATAILPLITNGTQGTYSQTSPTYTTYTVVGNGAQTSNSGGGYFPLTASEIQVLAVGNYKGNGASLILVAPATTYGGANNGPVGSNGAPGGVHWNIGNNVFWPISFVLEAATIAYCSSGAGASLFAQAWLDYYSAG